MAGERNMYGCLPCPKCKSKYRAPYMRGGRGTIECDDCGLAERWTGDFGDAGEVDAAPPQAEPAPHGSEGEACPACEGFKAKGRRWDGQEYDWVCTRCGGAGRATGDREACPECVRQGRPPYAAGQCPHHDGSTRERE